MRLLRAPAMIRGPIVTTPPPPPAAPAAPFVDLRPVTDVRRVRARATWGLLFLGAVLVLAFVVQLDARGEPELWGLGGPSCIVREQFGDGICPGCGLTRATVHAARGELGAAWACHPLGLLTLLYAAVGAGLHLVALLRGARTAFEVRILHLGARSYALALVLVAVWRVLCLLP